MQCVGCHLPHSQDFRLTDEALCGACHRHELDDFTHSAHNCEDITCTDCHLSTVAPCETGAVASADASIGGNAVPSHRFTIVSSEVCIACHGETIHNQVLGDASMQTTDEARLSTLANHAPELEVQLESAEQANKSLKVMMIVSLGLGLGIGGVLGVVFMLVISWIDRRVEKQ